ncbi:MAG: CPBP family intramembrane metalloprotease [Clostridia bacterium]|nr:CPBP family intramembrane metalloprotease [Clostridia bacterium]
MEHNAGYPPNAGPSYGGAPFGQQPYGQAPYGGAPGGQPFRRQPPARRQGLLERVKRSPAGSRQLLYLGGVFGIAILGHFALSKLYVYLVSNIGTLKTLYLEELSFSYLLEMAYTLFAVGLPFLAAWILLRRREPFKNVTISYGRGYDAYQSFMLVFAALGLCLIGNMVTNWLAAAADAVGLGFNSYYAAIEDTDIPTNLTETVLLVLHTAVLPALVEEFAFRGVVLQSLRRYGDWFAIVSTSLIFGLMHGTMTQAPFAVIAGLALGYTAVVTGSLKAGILVHFLNNGISVVLLLISGRYSETVQWMTSALIMYGMIAVGAAAFLFFILRNRYWRRLRPAKVPVRRPALFFLLSPPMLFALMLLIWRTLTDIKVVADVFGTF